MPLATNHRSTRFHPPSDSSFHITQNKQSARLLPTKGVPALLISGVLEGYTLPFQSACGQEPWKRHVNHQLNTSPNLHDVPSTSSKPHGAHIQKTPSNKEASPVPQFARPPPGLTYLQLLSTHHHHGGRQGWHESSTPFASLKQYYLIR